LLWPRASEAGARRFALREKKVQGRKSISLVPGPEFFAVTRREAW
jgi:hypothetical protein